MNYASVNLDLQSVIKRAYDNLLYRSTGMNFLNSAYLGEIRQAGTPTIEAVKQTVSTVTSSSNPVLQSANTPNLTAYESVKIDLAELRLDYSFRVPSIVLESGIAQIVDGQIELQDAKIASEVDKYIFDKLADTITGDRTSGKTVYDTGSTYNFAGVNYIEDVNALKSMLFNLNIYDGYKLGLEAVEYGKFVSALTSILKFETMAGVEGVDRGDVAKAYGVDIFAINTNVLTNGEIGYFASEVGVVGDAFFSRFNEWNGNYPGFAGDYVVEGAILFGAEVIRPEAIIKLVKTSA